MTGLAEVNLVTGLARLAAPAGSSLVLSQPAHVVGVGLTFLPAMAGVTEVTLVAPIAVLALATRLRHMANTPLRWMNAAQRVAVRAPTLLVTVRAGAWVSKGLLSMATSPVGPRVLTTKRMASPTEGELGRVLRALLAGREMTGEASLGTPLHLLRMLRHPI